MRVNTTGMAMSLETFRDLDYVQICEHLGLKPSKPWHNAKGEYVGPKRRRRRKSHKTAAQ